MNPEKWREIKDVFTSALEQRAGGLMAFLDEACGDDLELRKEVNRLLAEHFKAGEFLDRPLPGSHTAPAPQPLAGGTDQRFPPGSRFALRGRLGAGGFGEVYEAYDSQRDSPVALKYLRQFEPDQLYRLKREFRTLSDIRHSNVIQVYELFSSSDLPFFTMELLNGKDFGAYLRDTAADRAAGTCESYSHLRLYLSQLARGLIALHDAQLVHRDVKPSNVFLTKSGRVVLLDLGLVKHLSGTTSAGLLGLGGTPPYMAPEQITGATPSPASDWYSIGVLLFEALTGVRPFEGDVLEVLSRKSHEEAPLASALAPHAPADLNELCQGLLHRDPSARFGGVEVLHRLDARPLAARTQEAKESERHTSVFVGRDLHLQALQNALAEAEHGRTVCIHVRGKSGVGKTGVIRSFLDRVKETRRDCVVLSGRCYESESAPHKGLDELVDHLALFLRGLDPQRVQSLLPRYFLLLTRLFPVLRQFQPAGRGVPEIADPREQRHRAFGSLRECFERISESHTLVLWIDDLQWCDSDTIQLLNDMVQSFDPFGCLTLLSYRDDFHGNPELNALDTVDRSQKGGASVRRLDIENLPYEDARTLASALLQHRADRGDWSAAAEAIARESSGNPFFVTEMVRYLGSMPTQTDLSAGAFGIGHVIKRRVGLLSEPALRLLEVVAVAGQPLPINVCMKAATLGAQYLDVRTTLTREHLLRMHVSRLGEELDVYHDQVREAIMSYLSREAIRVYHRLLANALENTGSTDYERMSVHFENAGERERATEYMILAARHASEALAFDRAAKLLRRVLELASAAMPDDIHERLGDALSNASRGKDAAEAYLRASTGVDTVRRLDLQRRACEQYLRSGQVDEGITLIRQLLRELGVRYPESRLAVFSSLLWHRFRLRIQLHNSITKNLKPTKALSAIDQLRLDVTWTGALGLSLVDVVRGADFQARYTLLALRSSDPTRLALGLAGELALGRMGGGRPPEETDSLFRAAVRLATESGNPHALAFSISMRGIAAWIAGEWTECYDESVRAASIFTEKCSGVGWELTTANTFLLSALVFLGRWREHSLASPALIKQAQALGDRHGAISLPLIAYTYIHSLVADQPSEGVAMMSEALAAWPYANFQMQHCDALIGNIETQLYSGDAERALALFTSHSKRLRQSHLLDIQFYRVLMTGLAARTYLAAAIQLDGKSRASHLRRARRYSRQLIGSRTSWAIATGFLVKAGIATIDGSQNQALDHLRAAEVLFEKKRMAHYLAATRLRLSELEPRFTREKDLGQQWMSEQGVRNPARLTGMLAPGVWDRSAGASAHS